MYLSAFAGLLTGWNGDAWRVGRDVFALDGVQLEGTSPGWIPLFGRVRKVEDVGQPPSGDDVAERVGQVSRSTSDSPFAPKTHSWLSRWQPLV